MSLLLQLLLGAKDEGSGSSTHVDGLASLDTPEAYEDMVDQKREARSIDFLMSASYTRGA